MAIDYQWYKKNGICVQCLRYDASPGKVRCEVCLAKNAEVARKRREKMKSVSRAEEYRKMRETRKEQGLCIWCGKPRCSYSSVFCIDCRIKNQRKNNARKKGVARSERPLYGMCYRCGKQVRLGDKLCPECRNQSIDNLPEKHIIKSWKRDNNRVFTTI
jgi:hypothetical protein